MQWGTVRCVIYKMLFVHYSIFFLTKSLKFFQTATIELTTDNPNIQAFNGIKNGGLYVTSYRVTLNKNNITFF